MGEARRRGEKGLPPRQIKNNKKSFKSSFSWISLPESKSEQFFEITKLGAWIGIVILILSQM